MVRRRSKSAAERFADDLLDLLKTAPVWVGPLVAVGAFGLFYLLFPLIFGAMNEPLRGLFTNVSKVLSPILGVGVLLVWGVAELFKWRDRKLLARQADFAGLQSLTWREFERLVGEAFRRRGYHAVETPSGADGGVDLILRKDGDRAFVQCKHWKTWSVGVKPVRELMGVVAAKGATRGILVCGGRFTAEALRFAEGQPLELIDGPQLWRMIKEVQGGARHSAPEASRVEQAGSAQPMTEGTSDPTCPECNAPMILRTAKRGTNAGSQFFGCSRYPACRAVRAC